MIVDKSWPFLSEEEAIALKSEGKSNVQESPSRSLNSIWLSNLFTFYNMLNIVLAVLIATTGSFRNMFFLGIVLANYLIGTIQEIRAKKALDGLSILTEPKASVIRDGIEKTIKSEDLVLGDLMILHSGDQILADGTIVFGEIRVDESSITGEKDPVVHIKEDFIQSGSFVLSGEAAIKITAVGPDSFAQKIMLEGKKQKQSGSKLKSIMKKIIQMVSVFIIPMGILSFISHFFWQGMSYEDSMLPTVASMVGMIPDGLYLLTSVAFAAGVIRLVKKKALIQQLYSLESLARVDTLCLDKTGTITTGKMKFLRELNISGDNIGYILSRIYGVVPVDNETAKAIALKYGQIKSNREYDFLPFSSENKYVAVDFLDEGCYIFGAPEFVLKNNFPEEMKIARNLESEGARVLVLTKAKREEKIYKSYNVVGFILLEDEIRENAKSTFHFFEENGVKIKVISGDSARTVSDISKKAGIPDAEKYIDLIGLNDEEICEASQKYTVFGRVTPQQKKMIIHSLKEAGSTVAMTGDGINDVLGLKESDCSIAMANGAQAAVHASQIVLTDSDFGVMPDIVNEGRRVINNIQSSSSLFLMKTIYSFGITILAILFGFGYPFAPIQLTFISLLVSAIPGLVITFEPDFRRVKEDFLKSVLSRALLGAFLVIFGVLLILFGGEIAGLTLDEISTMCVLFTGFSSLVTLAFSIQPLTIKKIIMLLFCIAVFLMGIIFFKDLLMLVPLTKYRINLLVLCIISIIPYILRRQKNG